MRGWTKRLGQGIAALCVGYFALWACAPPAAMPPPVPHAAGAKQAGLAVSGVAGLDRCVYGLTSYGCLPPLPDGMVWALFSPGERFSFGPLLFGGRTSIAGGGLLFRYRLNQAPRFFVGAEVGIGLYWGSLGVPLSVAASDRVWLYTRPALTYSASGLLQLPLGATWALSERWSLNAELGTWLINVAAPEAHFDAPALYGALGAAYHF